MSLQNQLLTNLREAFSEVGRHPDADLFAVRDDYLWSESLHGGSGPWWDVPAEAIAHEPHALDELTVVGFKFFLPAYLSWIIQNPRSGYVTADTTISALDTSGCTEPMLTDRLARFGSLSPEQHAAVVNFLAWASCDDELEAKGAALKALSSFWARAQVTPNKSLERTRER
jgi:hypothetical protein